jgi:hypothetical protein
MAKRDAPKKYEWERVIRNFLDSCDFVGYPLDPAVRGQLLSELGYKIAPNGAIISQHIEVKYQLGQDKENLWTDTYHSDWEKRCAEENPSAPVDVEEPEAIADVEDQLDASTSESPEGN